MKHIILFLALLSFTVNAQDYKVTVQYNGTTKTASLVWTMPAADAQYFNARFGTDELAREAQQLVNRIRARIAEERERDAQRAWRWLTKAQQDAAIQKEQQYRDTVGTFERNNPPTQGALLPSEFPDIEPVGEYAFLPDINPSGNLRNIGKAVFTDYAPVFEYSGAIKADHAVMFDVPSWAPWLVLALALVSTVALSVLLL